MFRTNVYTAEAVDKKTGNPTGKPKKIWALGLVLLVELIGTFLMVFEIIAPSALQLEQFEWYNQVFGTYLMKAFWVAGFILILIFLLRWCSVNLNPAVTLAEVATGHVKKERAAWMIVIQVAGATLAAYAAYWMGANMEVFNAGVLSHNSQYYLGTYTLDAVFPVLQLSQNELSWIGDATTNQWIADGVMTSTGKFVVAPTGHNGDISAMTAFFGLWDAEWGYNSTALAWLAVVVAIEFVFTWLLLWSVVGAKRVSHNARPFLIFAVLMVVVTLGIHTNNIALNPARLVGPAVIAQVTGGAHTMQYVPFFLAGELLAVLAVAKTAGRREMKAAKAAYKETGLFTTVGTGVVTDSAVAAIKADEEAFKADIRDVVLHIQEDLEIVKARYKWVLEGKDPIETMTLEEVQAAIKAKKATGVIDTEQPVTVLRKEFAKYLGYGEAQYKELKKQAALAEIQARKAAMQAEQEAAKKDAPKAEGTKEAPKAGEAKEAPKAGEAAPALKTAPAKKKAPAKK